MSHRVCDGLFSFEQNENSLQRRTRTRWRLMISLNDLSLDGSLWNLWRFMNCDRESRIIIKMKRVAAMIIVWLLILNWIHLSVAPIVRISFPFNRRHTHTHHLILWLGSVASLERSGLFINLFTKICNNNVRTQVICGFGELIMQTSANGP